MIKSEFLSAVELLGLYVVDNKFMKINILNMSKTINFRPNIVEHLVIFREETLSDIKDYNVVKASQSQELILYIYQ